LLFSQKYQNEVNQKKRQVSKLALETEKLKNYIVFLIDKLDNIESGLDMIIY